MHMHSSLTSLRQGQVHVGPIPWEVLPHFKHSVGNGRPFQPLPPPPPRGGSGEPRRPQQQEGGGGGAFPRVDGEVNAIFTGHWSQENKRQ
jgi:hypothetical protein